MMLRVASILTALFGLAVANWLPRMVDADRAAAMRDWHFTLSSDCGICHIAAPGAKAWQGEGGQDLSPYFTWQATMMANSFRDPYFRAQLMKETEAAGEQVQELCLRCHTPMVHHEAVMNGDAPPRLAVAEEEILADDGVSCTVCHMITADGLGEARTFSGRPVFNEDRKIFGPFADVEPRPMQSMFGYTPVEGGHIRKAALCGTCHTLETEHEGVRFAEQSPYLEWRNSEFSDERDGADPEKTRTCQQCHMPAVGSSRLARTPMGFDYRGIPEREGVRSHAFVGGNAFMLDMLREHRDDLLVEATDEQLLAMAAATRAQLAERTARLVVSPLELQSGRLRFSVAIENLTGHKFPTAYPSRRAWLCVEIVDGDRVVFASGAFDDQGRLVGIDDELRIPHVDVVRAPTDVAVFEMVATDPDGEPTTHLMRMVGKRKDTRLLPRGFRPDGPHVADTAPVGIGDDADFTAGGDTVAFDVPLPADAGPDVEVRATLLYQSVPPAWVDALRNVAADEAVRFVAYYDAADKVPERVAHAIRGLAR